MAKRYAYTTPTGYKITGRKYKELSRAVENYNRRVARLEKKYVEQPWINVPQRMQVRVLREQPATLKELNQIIDDLSRFKRSGLEIVEENGVFLTKAEAYIYQRDVKKENIRRGDLQKEVKTKREQQSRFPVQEEINLRPLTEHPKSIETLRKNIEKSQPSYQRQRMNTWKQNYVQRMRDYKEEAIIAGAYTEEAGVAIDRIIQLVRAINDQAFYWAQMLENDIIIERFYESQEFLARVSLTLTVWEDYFSRQNDFT